ARSQRGARLGREPEAGSHDAAERPDGEREDRGADDRLEEGESPVAAHQASFLSRVATTISCAAWPGRAQRRRTTSGSARASEEWSLASTAPSPSRSAGRPYRGARRSSTSVGLPATVRAGTWTSTVTVPSAGGTVKSG